MTQRAATIVVAVVFAAGCARACGADERAAATAPPDSGRDASTGGSGGTPLGTGGTYAEAGDASKPCVPPLKPDIVPEGWEPYTDFSCTQPFYVPSSEKYLPEAIVWEACPAPSSFTSGCKWMKVTWADPGALQIAKLAPSASGSPLLSFMRIVYPPGGTGHEYSLVAEASGAIRFALLDPRTPQDGTLSVMRDLTEDRFAIEVAGGTGKKADAFDSQRKGVLVGTVGTLRPTLFQLEATPAAYSWRISSKLLARAEAPAMRVTIFPLDGSLSFQLASMASDPDGLPPADPILLGDTAVFTAESLLMAGIMAYDPVQKTHPLIRWYGDQNQGAYNAGTDGKDLVWTYGEVHPPPNVSISYVNRSVWTSPFSTDPKKLVPKRLRSDPQTAYDVNFAVGCGYAAHNLQPPDGLLVVRLSDGVSWILPNNIGAPGDAGWLWDKAIGMTCDELFATVGVVATPGAKVVYTIARVRLDALGPGLPPD